MTTTAHHTRRPARERRPLSTVPVATETDVRAELIVAVSSTSAAKDRAAHDLRVSELARRHAGQALERDLRPMRIDEAARAALRAEYATADAEVARRRQALERATRIDDAAREIATAMAEPDAADATGAADAAGSVLLAWSRLRDSLSGPRFASA